MAPRQCAPEAREAACKSFAEILKRSPEQLKPKAREAFGNSLIDIGIGLYKGCILLIISAVLTFGLKVTLDEKSFSKSDLEAFLLSPSYFIVLFFFLLIALTLVGGVIFQRLGLHHIHESENQSS